MSRLPRNFIHTSFFHVITQGINKSYIFNNPEDIKYYIKLMHQLSKEHTIKIIAYCIMNNHTHMLIQTYNSNDLSKYMQRLNTKYAIYYNKKYDRVGYVFRNRFKSEGICNEQHLYNCINYIYNNPVKAGICESADKYPYSNYRSQYSTILIDNNYKFLEVDEDNDNISEILYNFLNKNNLSIERLKNRRDKLKEIIKILKESYHISLRRISKELNINRETIRKLYK